MAVQREQPTTNLFSLVPQIRADYKRTDVQIEKEDGVVIILVKYTRTIESHSSSGSSPICVR
jgi:hypothetical protein